MDNVGLQHHLLRLFQRFGVELEPDEEGYLATDGDLPLLHAQWHEGTAGAPGRLDIDVVLDEERSIEESFAGRGGGKTACLDALRAFEQSAFHVLLAACWYVTDERRMRLASWQLGLRTWDVFISPFALHGVDITELEILDQVPAAIESALQREALTPELHWLRLMYRRTADGEARCEVLLDNEPWTTGAAALTALAWPQAGDYSAHGLMLLDVRDY